MFQRRRQCLKICLRVKVKLEPKSELSVLIFLLTVHSVTCTIPFLLCFETLFMGNKPVVWLQVSGFLLSEHICAWPQGLHLEKRGLKFIFFSSHSLLCHLRYENDSQTGSHRTNMIKGHKIEKRRQDFLKSFM